jgi:hypothetical protein
MRVIAEVLSRKIRKLLIPQPDRVLAMPGDADGGWERNPTSVKGGT